jgi:hypothetical protein
VEFPAENVANPMLRVYHDEDAEVYINGRKIASLRGYTTSYALVPLPAEATKLLRAGPMTVAVHCHQTTGGQFIDVGIVDVLNSEP